MGVCVCLYVLETSTKICILLVKWGHFQEMSIFGLVFTSSLVKVDCSLTNVYLIVCVFLQVPKMVVQEDPS